MRNIKITVEYDGGAFSGWQTQPGERTVQGEIANAASKIAGKEVRIIGAGRTDAGVHAVGQAANFNIDTKHSLVTIRNSLNGNLPSDILVRRAEEVSPGFHARFDACSKTYNYVFIKKRTSLWRKRFICAPESIDVDAMRFEASKLKGERDFSAFASVSDSKTGSCRVISSSIYEQRPLIIFSVTADRFLYNMVRAMAGTLLEIGKGKQFDIRRIMESKDRSAAGPTLPPHALYLMEVRYTPLANSAP